MSRICTCSRQCRHFVRGSSEALLQAERLVQLEPVLSTLVDYADAYDSETLTFDPDCPSHGDRPMSNAVCICRGERLSGMEMIQALMLDVRSAVNSRREPLSQDRRARWARKERSKALEAVAV